ncbi:MAG: 3-phosphoshikimate 1-carboxyvinyltransferase [Thermomicrobiales bacterium]|jgi:3-phosphoshikimate 1-carboxyvinyltransferase|nr:3-phosphoshikimate 1-carboxyvinyltransferase [Thermomicrobiales bacterium]
MTATTYPDVTSVATVTRPIDAVARIPGSKSITNRALLAAALADGESELSGALHSDDTRYMAAALNALGVGVETDEPGERFRVQGGGGTFPATQAELFVGNAGTAMRFLTAALPLGRGTYRIDGVPRMRKRPLAPLLQALTDLGADAVSEEGTGCPPVVVRASGLRGGRTTMAGDQSSQFFSALLLAAPYAEQGVEVEVVGDLVSKPYMPMTAAVMRAFGVEMELDTEHWRTFRVAPGQRYLGRAHRIEPDASNASYFFAAAAVTGGRVRVDGLGRGSTQGDLRFVDVLAVMGATVTVADDYVEVIGPPAGALKGVDLDLNAISDTAQTLAAIAPFATGPTTIRGVGHARLKETDRVAALATELRRLGQTVEERPDGLTIHPSPIVAADVQTYDDHRMAMSFAITALRAPGVRILDPGCVAKTFPDFFARLEEAVSA